MKCKYCGKKWHHRGTTEKTQFYYCSIEYSYCIECHNNGLDYKEIIMDKIDKVFLDETELKQANKYKDEIGSDPIVCRMLVTLNELIEGYNEMMKRYEDLCKVIGLFGSQYDKLIKRLEVLKILQLGELKAKDSK